MTPARAVSLNVGLTTERLVLEPLVAAHADLMFAPSQDEAIYTWIPGAPPESVERLRERWTRHECRLSPAGDEAWLNWAVRRAREGDYVGKMDVAVNAASVATNVGYVFFPAFWGRGYASEAVGGVIAHLASHGITQLRATVTMGNVASARVLEKVGFARTRVLPGAETIRGVTHDDIEYVRGE